MEGRVERFSAAHIRREDADLRDDLHLFGLSFGLRIHDEYIKLDHVDGLPHRELDLAAPLLAVAAAVDQHSTAQPSLRDRLLVFLRGNASARQASDRIWNDRAALARAITQYVAMLDAGGVHRVRWGDHDDWVFAADLTEFVNQSGEMDRDLTTRGLGERVRRYKFNLADRVLDVPHRAGALDQSATRLQKVAFRFDLERVKQAAGGTL